MRVSLAQINSSLGDFEHNSILISRAIEKALVENIDLLLLPEMALSGYPPEDLLYKKHFVDENLRILRRVASKTGRAYVIGGFVDRDRAGRLFNAAAVMCNKKIIAIHHKNCLPNYGVFDEKRYFHAGTKPCIVSLEGIGQIALTLCEDIWDLEKAQLLELRKKKLKAIVNLSASPYHLNKTNDRLRMLKNVAKLSQTPVLYCNAVGGQDELVFDGRSCALDKTGKLLLMANAFREDWQVSDLSSANKIKDVQGAHEVLEALCLGLRDYVSKNAFAKVILGLSGGIDSAVVAAIAVKALGEERVECITMPSSFTSSETLHDAEILAKNLRIRCERIPIKELHHNYLSALHPYFKNMPPGIAEENLQARIRGNVLMAFSNKFGHLVLTTGNKSELATGYCTLYGDMAGGFALIKDVPKTMVYKIAHAINDLSNREIIPHTTIGRPPTAELRADQKDSDSLPAYDMLDKILELYIEDDLSIDQIVKAGFDRSVVADIVRRVEGNEYKRRQAPLGVKITPKSFGKDRRIPITNGFKA